MRSQRGPRRAWPRRHEERVRANARVRGAPARVERPLDTTPRVELPVREHAPRLWGARLRVGHRYDGALASSAELGGSAEPSGRAVAASSGCRHVRNRRRPCAQSSCATENSVPASKRTERLLELRNASPAARACQSGLARPLEPTRSSLSELKFGRRHSACRADNAHARQSARGGARAPRGGRGGRGGPPSSA